MRIVKSATSDWNPGRKRHLPFHLILPYAGSKEEVGGVLESRSLCPACGTAVCVGEGGKGYPPSKGKAVLYAVSENPPRGYSKEESLTPGQGHQTDRGKGPSATPARVEM